MNIQEDPKVRRLKVIEGIETLLALFEGAGQPLFPRKIMTAKYSGQFTAYSKEQMIKVFEEADFVDCRINAYPKLPSGTLQPPNIILVDIDIDWSLKSGYRLVKQKLNKTLRNIEEYCSLDNPLVLWTGNGYHVYIVLHMSEPLEYIQEYVTIGSVKDISREFMLFSKTLLSDNKADRKDNPSFESCLLRVPYSLNSKCFCKGMDVAAAQVKIIQNWNGHAAAMNEIPLLLSGYYTHLISKKKNAAVYKTGSIKIGNNNNNNNNLIHWIEALLQNGIVDHRKYVVSLILIPYFVNIKGLLDTDTIGKLIKGWLSKCNKLRPLDSVCDFDSKIRYYIERCKTNKNLKPISFDKLQESNPDLYRTIRSGLKV
jgi:hypothetical protein